MSKQFHISDVLSIPVVMLVSNRHEELEQMAGKDKVVVFIPNKVD